MYPPKSSKIPETTWETFSSWWFQSTHLKNMSQNGFIFPKVRDENSKKSLSCHHLVYVPTKTPWNNRRETFKVPESNEVVSGCALQKLGWQRSVPRWDPAPGSPSNVKKDGNQGGFLKWWVSPTNPWGFPTKNDHDLGCEMGVPLFLETPISMVQRRMVMWNILLMDKIRLTSGDGKYPIIYRVSYIPGGAGFPPSTVTSMYGIFTYTCTIKIN